MDKVKDKKVSLSGVVEVIIVVMLGVTALCTAWASWIGSLHGGNQATNYAMSNNLASEGNSEYNAAIQQLNNDQMLWNDISDLQFDIFFAQDKNDTDALEKNCYVLFYKLNDNLSESMAEKLGWKMVQTEQEINDPQSTILKWMENTKSTTSPFDEEYVTSYFTNANELLEKSQKVLEQGQSDNAHGDAFGLVTVLYSITLFLLGISSSFVKPGFKYAIVIISIITFIIATVYMCTIPMPIGFSFSSFFGS